MHRKTRLLMLTAAALLAFALGSATTSAATNPQAENHCIAPSGVDLNEFFGLAEQFVAPFCGDVTAGESWRVPALWLMNSTYAAAPAGFVPAAPTPLGDFLAKFTGVKHVVDAGTSAERTYVFRDTSALWIGFLGLPAVNTVTMGVLHPLPVGSHVVDTYWLISGTHCDGLGDGLANCLTGEAHVAHTAFDVRVPQS